jgi:hypothetical protein
MCPVCGIIYSLIINMFYLPYWAAGSVQKNPRPINLELLMMGMMVPETC